MELEVYRRYSQMARGLEKAELVFKNGRVFSSGTGEFIGRCGCCGWNCDRCWYI